MASLLDQLESEAPAGPWRVLFQAEGEALQNSLEQPFRVEVVPGSHLLMACRPPDAAPVVRLLDEEGRALDVIPWTWQGVAQAVREVPQGVRWVEVEPEEGHPWPERLLLWELQGHEGRTRDLARARQAWVASEDRFDATVASRRFLFPMAHEGTTRTGLALIPDQRVEFALPRGARSLRFWTLPLAGPAPSWVVVEVLAGEKWRVRARVPVGKEGWGAHRVRLRHGLGPRPRAVRFGVEGPQAMVGLCEPLAFGPRRRPTAPNVVVLLHDTMRADRLGFMGYRKRPTSSSLDSLVSRGSFAVFSRAYAASPWTLPSISKLFASLARDFHTEAGVGYEFTLLAEVLRRHGYSCVAFTGGAHMRATGLEQGFHEYHWSRDWGKVEDCYEPARAWLSSRPPEPFFLFLHDYEAHTPYTRATFCRGMSPGRLGDLERGEELFPPGVGVCTELSFGERAYVEAAYDGGVSAACDATVRLFRLLEELGLWERTVVVMTSDHGEEFWDHLPTFAHHGHTVYHELIHVPLLMRLPHGKAARVDEPVSLVDVAPTILDAVGIGIPGSMEGVSLLPLLAGGEVERSVPIFAQVSPGPEVVVQQGCVIHGGWKYIRGVHWGGEGKKVEPCTQPPPGHQVFSLADDPGETLNLWGRDPARDSLLVALLDGFLASAPGPPGAGPFVPPALRQQLRELGYLTDP